MSFRGEEQNGANSVKTATETCFVWCHLLSRGGVARGRDRKGCGAVQGGFRRSAGISIYLMLNDSTEVRDYL